MVKCRRFVSKAHQQPNKRKLEMFTNRCLKTTDRSKKSHTDIRKYRIRGRREEKGEKKEMKGEKGSKYRKKKGGEVRKQEE